MASKRSRTRTPSNRNRVPASRPTPSPLPRGRRPYERRTSYLKRVSLSKQKKSVVRELVDRQTPQRRRRKIDHRRLAELSTRRAAKRVRPSVYDGQVEVKASAKPAAHLNVANREAKASVKGPYRQQMHEVQREPLRVCKERPKSNRGRGGSRAFIPWCERRS